MRMRILRGCRVGILAVGGLREMVRGLEEGEGGGGALLWVMEVGEGWCSERLGWMEGEQRLADVLVLGVGWYIWLGGLLGVLHCVGLDFGFRGLGLGLGLDLELALEFVRDTLLTKSK